MRRVRYAVAMSLNGYIAGLQGESDWIVMDPDIDFASIFNQFDTILVGRRTFEAMARAGNTAMPGMKTVVCSRTLLQSDYPGVTIIGENAESAVAAMRAGDGKDIWLFGGGRLFGSLVAANMVDTVEVSVIPVLLGSGVPLVTGVESPLRLELTKERVYKSGVVSLEYRVID